MSVIRTLVSLLLTVLKSTMWSVLILVCSVGAIEENWLPARQGGEDGEILQVHILFRHGHRVPRNRYPNDPNNNASFWNNGPGQLTNLGLQQGHSFGVALRERYSSLLPNERAWMKVRAESSDIPRTMMTAAVVLAGMLPVAGDEQWTNLTTWRPAPIHTKPMHVDNTISPSLSCPKLKRYRAMELVTTAKVRKMLSYIESHSGRRMKNGIDLLSMYTLFEIEKGLGLELPAWVNKVYPERMTKETAKVICRSANTRQAARLRSGPLIETLTNFNENSIEEPVRVYATHDNVIAGLMTSLAIDLEKPPGFISAVVIEYRSVNGSVHGQFLWRHQTGEQLKRIEWPGCGLIRCPIETIKVLVKPLIPRDWNFECRIPKEEIFVNPGIKNLPSMILSFALIIIVIAILVEVIKRRHYEYIPSRNI